MLLKSNPSFARVCGFIPKHVRDEYCSEHIPSLRKLEQFDQIMTESGIWAKIKLVLMKMGIRFSIRASNIAFCFFDDLFFSLCGGSIVLPRKNFFFV